MFAATRFGNDIKHETVPLLTGTAATASPESFPGVLAPQTCSARTPIDGAVASRRSERRGGGGEEDGVGAGGGGGLTFSALEVETEVWKSHCFQIYRATH